MSFWKTAAKKTLCLQQQWGPTSAQAALEITAWIHLNNSHEAQPDASWALLGRDTTSPCYFTPLPFPDTAMHSLHWCGCLPDRAITWFKFLTSSPPARGNKWISPGYRVEVSQTSTRTDIMENIRSGQEKEQSSPLDEWWVVVSCYIGTKILGTNKLLY